MQTYFEVLLKGVKSTDEDYVGSVLFDLGAQGIVQDLKFVQVAENFNPEIIHQDIVDLKAFFTEAVSIEQLQSLQSFCQSLELQEEEQKDWLEEWKKHFKAFAITHDYWVVPSWLKTPASEDKTIYINPGLAFGTGTHPTTQLVAQLIYEQLVIEKLSVNKSLDLGAGTGILSVLMGKMGVPVGEATEIDAMAREKCVENFELNHMQERFQVHDENYVFKAQDPYPLVVANIIDGVLLNLKEAIQKVTSDTLIVSGILDERNEKFQKEFIEKLNLKVVRDLRLQEWWAYVLKVQ